MDISFTNAGSYKRSERKGDLAGLGYGVFLTDLECWKDVQRSYETSTAD